MAREKQKTADFDLISGYFSDDCRLHDNAGEARTATSASAKYTSYPLKVNLATGARV